jgi:hypothetical protein
MKMKNSLSLALICDVIEGKNLLNAGTTTINEKEKNFFVCPKRENSNPQVRVAPLSDREKFLQSIFNISKEKNLLKI